MQLLTLSDMGGEHLEVVDKYTFLGVIIRSDLKWHDNTDFICQKGYARLWLLRRSKGSGADVLEMLDVYEKQVRTVLEMAMPVWQPALTQQEGVQRCFCIPPPPTKSGNFKERQTETQEQQQQFHQEDEQQRTW